MNIMRTISIPEDLCTKAEQKFGARFGNVEDFLITIMNDLLRDDAAALDEREQKIIEERLKGLGYI